MFPKPYTVLLKRVAMHQYAQVTLYADNVQMAAHEAMMIAARQLDTAPQTIFPFAVFEGFFHDLLKSEQLVTIKHEVQQ